VQEGANVVWLNHLTDNAELRHVYAGAGVFVFASLYEGFGIPVAEALACGCPIVTSAGSAMAEFAGDDATYVDPLDVESIRDGIARATRPAPRRVASWADVAARTRAVYEAVA
jgi:alpha-1,3-rhamnosyl/mannosyltransferase